MKCAYSDIFVANSRRDNKEVEEGGVPPPASSERSESNVFFVVVLEFDAIAGDFPVQVQHGNGQHSDKFRV